MSVFFRRSAGAAIIYAVAVQGAWADLTANDVWTDWTAYLGSMGYKVTGSENTSGNVLTVSGIGIEMQVPDTDGTVTMTMPEVSLTDNGDGTVAIAVPGQFPITFAVVAEGKKQASGEINYAQQDFLITASGDPNDITYDYTAKSVNVSLDKLEAEGEQFPPDALKASMSMGDVTGRSRMTVGEMRQIEQSLTSGSLTYEFGFTDPGSSDSASFFGSLSDLIYSGTGTLPAEFDMANYANMLASGFAFDADMSYGAGSGEMQGSGDGESFAMSSKSGGGVFKIAMDAQHVLYDISQKDAAFSVTTSELPFPIEMAMSALGLKVDMPVQEAETAQPFGFGMKLADFTMSDMLWSMFDPSGALPRDPATVALDATGTAKVLVNFLDPAVAQTLEATGAVPGTLETLKINELLISMVGAKLSGTGDFAFDNSNLEEFGGMPAPAGVADLQLVGANSLIDKLIAMGFVSDQDAMGARMMMGMLAVPGDAPDTLNSRIEINNQGHIMANGQRIK